MSDTYLVYKHVAPNGKVYIGITSQTTQARWHGGSNYSTQPYFYNAIKKYGWDAFEHVVIREGLSEEEAKIAERKLIKQYDSRNRSKGYNITPGGDISPMKDPIVRQKSSEAHKGKRLSEEQKRKLGEAHKGYVPSEEAKKKTSASVTELWKDPEYRKRNQNGQKKFYRPVEAYDANGGLIGSWGSLKEADAATGVDFRNIQACCKGKRRIAGGYIWRYVDKQVDTEVNAETKESA